MRYLKGLMQSIKRLLIGSKRIQPSPDFDFDRIRREDIGYKCVVVSHPTILVAIDSLSKLCTILDRGGHYRGVWLYEELEIPLDDYVPRGGLSPNMLVNTLGGLIPRLEAHIENGDYRDEHLVAIHRQVLATIRFAQEAVYVKRGENDGQRTRNGDRTRSGGGDDIL
jgi:hypothetical protein